MHIENRVQTADCAVALETTLLVHGVPLAESVALHNRLRTAVQASGRAEPALVGLVHGKPVIGVTTDELRELIANPADLPIKINTANLGLAAFRKVHGATTVSATVEIAARGGLTYMATGGLGGVHQGYGESLDVSADLLSLARFPVAVVCSGVKSLLDVAATREALETLGVPVIGYRTDAFPAFYQRHGRRPDGSSIRVDARFDDDRLLDRFVRSELARTGRGIVIAQPVDAASEIDGPRWDAWLAQATRESTMSHAAGRDVTPAILAALHRISGGATLQANIELVLANAALAGRLAGARS